MSETWTFDDWFRKQHGPRPGSIDIPLLRDRINSAVTMLAHDRVLLADLESWEARRTSALYAWQIADSKKLSGRRLAHESQEYGG